MKPQILVVSILSALLTFLACGVVADVVAAPAPAPVVALVDAGPVTVAPFEASPEVAPTAAPTPVQATPAAAPALPDPVAEPGEALGLLARAWKGGGLPAALVVVLFFGLTLAQRWIAWLRVGWRRLVVSSLLGALAILTERVAAGTTPTLGMVLGALGAALALYTQAQGLPKPAPGIDIPIRIPGA